VPEIFDATLREGTRQVAAALASPPAAELRELGERRARRRKARSIALCAAALLAVGGTTAGVCGLRGPQAGPAASVAATKDTGPSHPATAAATGSAAAAGPVQVSISGPAAYAAETANKVQVSIANPGPARAVIVEFDTTGTGIFEWTEGCDAGTDGGCSETNLSDNLLQLTQGALGKTTSQAVRFSLQLPHGTHTYQAWVNPPRNAGTFTVRVLDEQAVKVFGSAESPRIVTGFPTLKLISQASHSIARSGGYVEFSTTVANPTGGGYINLDQIGTVACFAGGSPVSVSSNDYSLQWFTGGGAGSWTALVNGAAWQAMGYDLPAGESTTTKFRLRLSGSLSAEVTSCQVTLTVSNQTTSKAPYFDASQPKGQAVVDFTVH
jgi:hypothetical protein